MAKPDPSRNSLDAYELSNYLPSRCNLTDGSSASVMISSLFDDMHLVAAPLMNAIRPKSADTEGPMDPNGLMETVHTVRAFFEFITALPPQKLSQFSSADWVHVIVAIILAYRLTLPIEICPEFDSAQARQILDYGSFLEMLCKDPDADAPGTASKKIDVCAAFRVVLGSLKAKHESKVAAAKAKEGVKRKARECPMFDGSLDDYILMWDGHGIPSNSSYSTSQSSTSGVLTNPIVGFSPSVDPSKPMVVPDLWATMTMDWSNQDMPDFGFEGTQTDFADF